MKVRKFVEKKTVTVALKMMIDEEAKEVSGDESVSDFEQLQ